MLNLPNRSGISTLSLIKEVRGDYSQYFKSIKADHFGNIYVVDNINSQVFKFTAALELLDSEGGDDVFAALGNVDIPFGKMVIVSGWKNFTWDRRNDAGVQVPVDTYRYGIAATSAYREEPTVSLTQFYLPMYIGKTVEAVGNRMMHTLSRVAPLNGDQSHRSRQTTMRHRCSTDSKG